MAQMVRLMNNIDKAISVIDVKMFTALVRKPDGNLKIMRYDDYNTAKEMEEDLRGNGYRVLKIWNGYKSDAEVDRWEFINRK